MRQWPHLPLVSAVNSVGDRCHGAAGVSLLESYVEMDWHPTWLSKSGMRTSSVSAGVSSLLSTFLANRDAYGVLWAEVLARALVGSAEGNATVRSQLCSAVDKVAASARARRCAGCAVVVANRGLATTTAQPATSTNSPWLPTELTPAEAAAIVTGIPPGKPSRGAVATPPQQQLVTLMFSLLSFPGCRACLDRSGEAGSFGQ